MPWNCAATQPLTAAISAGGGGAAPAHRDERIVSKPAAANKSLFFMVGVSFSGVSLPSRYYILRHEATLLPACSSGASSLPAVTEGRETLVKA